MKKILYFIAFLAVMACIEKVWTACSSDGTRNRSLTEMLDENDFAAANKYISNVASHCSNSYELSRDYLPKATMTLKAEATYLMDQDDSDAETLFMLCLNDVAGLVGSFDQPVLGFYDGDSQVTDYIIDQITPYNACLLSIIREAIIKNKPDFAKKVFKMMKQNYACEKRLKPGKDSGYVSSYTYNYTEDNSQIEEAKKILSEIE